MRPEMSHHIPVPRLCSLWSGTGGTRSPRAAGTACGASPWRGASRGMFVTSFTSSACETGILNYQFNLGSYPQAPHHWKTSPPHPWYTAQSHIPQQRQVPIQSWHTTNRLLLGQQSWPGFQEVQTVPSSKTSRAQPCRRGTAAWCSWKAHREPVDAGGWQKQAQLAGERHRDHGQRLEPERSWW